MNDHEQHCAEMARQYRQMAERLTAQAAESTDPQWIAYLGADVDAKTAWALAFDVQGKAHAADAATEALTPDVLRSALAG